MINERNNPYKQLRNWIKGEILSLEAIVETIESTEKILEKKKKAQGTIKDKNEAVEKLQKGKFSFGSMLKSSEGKAQQIQEMQKSMADLERDIVNYDLIYNILTVYMATIQLPAYNKNRCSNYMTAMKVFSDGIVGNALAQQDTWKQFKNLVISFEGKPQLEI